MRRKDFPPLEAGEHYTVDLVGAEAKMDGHVIGKVIDITSYPTLDVIVLSDGKQIWEVPMNEEYVGDVDADAGRVEILSLDELEPTPVRTPKPKTSKPPRKPDTRTEAQKVAARKAAIERAAAAAQAEAKTGKK